MSSNTFGDDGTSSGSGTSGTTSTSTGGTTGSTGTSTDGPTSAETDPEGGSFIPDLDDGGAGGDCDPGLQDCPEGEKCTAYVSTPGYCCVDANKCVEIIGDKQFGDYCQRENDNDDCAKGLFCMTKTSGGEGQGVCLQMCDVNNPGSCLDAGQVDASCIAFNDGTLPLCESSCHPFEEDCEEPAGCYPVGFDWYCALPPWDPALEGWDCYALLSCEPGLYCGPGDVQADCDSEKCCTPFCDVSGDGPGCPQPGEECVPFYEQGMTPPGYEDVGTCGIP